MSPTISALSRTLPDGRSSTGEKRLPLWSVMVPVFRPDENYLRQTLKSVLQQDPGPEQMQIEIVDDCSPGTQITALVREIAGDRVQVSQTPKNLGLAGCWNTCIERSHGEWVHLLHQDDLVLPGFYSQFEALFSALPDLDAAFSRYVHADAEGHWTLLGPLILRNAGVVTDFNVRAATWVPMQCAAAVVKRTTYERLGGYRKDIPYVLDWEMWCRIAASGCWGYVPQPGAVYREHDQSETTRLRKAGKTYQDFFDGGQLARAHFSRTLQEQTANRFRAEFVNYVIRDATALYVRGCPKEAGRLLDSFHGVAVKSNHYADWWWLRLRALIKPFRQKLAHAGCSGLFA